MSTLEAILTAIVAIPVCLYIGFKVLTGRER
jgi:hypothetical protein